MKKGIIYLVIFVLFSACADSSQVIDSKYNVTFDDSHFVEAKDLITNVEVIELDTVKEAFIPVINKISVHGDKIFCFSCEQNGFIKVFNLDGKYLYQISHRGSANDEWIRLKSMYIDEKEEIIILTDGESKKVLIYTMDGRFVKSQKLGDFDYHQITYKDGHFYSQTHTFMTGYKPTKDTEYKLNIYDHYGHLETRAVPLKLNDAKMMELNNHHFYMGQERCLYSPTLDNTVYVLEDGICSPYITYNYDGKSPMYTEEDIQEAIKNDEWMAGIDKLFWGGMVVESPSIIIRRMGDEQAKDVILYKENGNVITTAFDYPVLMRHHLSENFLFPYPHCYSNGYYYGILQYELLSYPPKYTDGYIPDNIKELAERVLTGTVNNVIIRYKLKKL